MSRGMSEGYCIKSKIKWAIFGQVLSRLLPGGDVSYSLSYLYLDVLIIWDLRSSLATS